MQFNVAQLLKDPIGSVRDYELVEDIGDLDDGLDILGPLVGDVQLLRTHSGVMVKGNLSTAIRVTCNRCLEPIASPVRLGFEECFRPLTEVSTGRYISPEEFEGEPDDLRDEALLINEQHILDISEVVRQCIWLVMPMYPGCNWDGEGECPNLTAYLDSIRLEQEDLDVTVSEGAQLDAKEEEVIDPRWAKLLELQQRMNEAE